MRAWTSVVAFLAIVAGAGAAMAQEDLRQRFGCRTVEAARDLQACMKAGESKRYDEAVKFARSALAREKDLQMARYWLASMLEDSGRLDEAAQAYQAAIDCPQNFQLLTAQSAYALGLMLGRLGRFDESRYWVGRALLEDASNREKTQPKSYRTLAVTLSKQGEFLSAGLSAMLGRDLDPERVEEDMIDQFMEEASSREQESAVVIRLEPPGSKPAVAARAVVSELTAARKPPAIDEQVVDLLADPQGRFVVALARDKRHYWLIDTRNVPAARKIETDLTIYCGGLADGRLYLAGDSPNRLVTVDPQSGRSLAEAPLGDSAPRSIAPLPAVGLLLFARNDSLHSMDLAGGPIRDLKKPCMFVAAHPGGQMAFGYTKKIERMEQDVMFINGHPVLLTRGGGSWTQSMLHQFVVGRDGVLLAALRANAASNATRIEFSPDGQFVALVGGGGWRPQGKDKNRGGYYVPVYRTGDISQMAGAFATEAYPLAFGFNPVTGQVAVVRKDDVRVYPLAGDADKAEQKLPGPFGTCCAWTGNGRWLLVANEKQGVSAFQNRLSEAEAARAGSWHRQLKFPPLVHRQAGGGKDRSRPADPAYAAFAVVSDRAKAAAALDKALNSAASESLADWDETDLWGPPTEAGRKLYALLTGPKEPEGIRIYKLRSLLKEYPGHAAALHRLGRALRSNGQSAEAKAALTDAVRADAGRTKISIASLFDIAQALTADGEKKDLNGAVYCLSMALLLDRAEPHVAAFLAELLPQAGFEAQADRLKKELEKRPEGGAVGRQLAELPAPPPADPMSPTRLFAVASPSVVRVSRGRSSGTGFCVGSPGVLVTNRHVIGGGEPIRVTLFDYRDGKAVRLPKTYAAFEVYRAEDSDLAVLRLTEQPPASLRPLPVAAATPAPGAKVWAIGNPGLGRQVLEQSITEGIVSAARTLDGHSYIQHSAAVNPGNSGGPLLDNRGRVVGINTLKANLQNVNFAIPPEVLRAVFKQH